MLHLHRPVGIDLAQCNDPATRELDAAGLHAIDDDREWNRSNQGDLRRPKRRVRRDLGEVQRRRRIRSLGFGRLCGGGRNGCRGFMGLWFGFGFRRFGNLLLGRDGGGITRCGRPFRWNRFGCGLRSDRRCHRLLWRNRKFFSRHFPSVFSTRRGNGGGR